jgi:hypothetical protein
MKLTSSAFVGNKQSINLKMHSSTIKYSLFVETGRHCHAMGIENE